MDKILDMADAAGIKYYVDTDNQSYWPYTDFPTAIQFLPGWNFTLCGMLENTSRQRAWRFSMKRRPSS
jgi:hypothetical protein